MRCLTREIRSKSALRKDPGEVLQAGILFALFDVPLVEHAIGDGRILAPRW
jgi:hypothetical protein